MCLGVSFILLQLLCAYCMIGTDLADCKHYNPNRSFQFLSTYCVPCTVLSDFIPMRRDPLSTCCPPGSDLGAVICPILSELLLCALSVLPTLELTQQPMGNQVNISTCQVNKFYPRDLQLTWLENGIIFWTEVTLTLIENKNGTFNWTSWLLVNSSAHREAVVLTTVWRAASGHQKSYPGGLCSSEGPGHPQTPWWGLHSNWPNSLFVFI